MGWEGFVDVQCFLDVDVVCEGVVQCVDIGLVFIIVQLYGGQFQSLCVGDYFFQWCIVEDVDVLQWCSGDYCFGLGVIYCLW